LTPPSPDPEKTKGELQKEIPRDSLMKEMIHKSREENASAMQEPLVSRVVGRRMRKMT
jgi:hypothetical protein